jgi:hypothetical protein
VEGALHRRFHELLCCADRGSALCDGPASPHDTEVAIEDGALDEAEISEVLPTAGGVSIGARRGGDGRSNQVLHGFYAAADCDASVVDERHCMVAALAGGVPCDALSRCLWQEAVCEIVQIIYPSLCLQNCLMLYFGEV